MKCLILCAGLGTRLGKLTENTPKCMIKVAGKPILEHLIDKLNSFGVYDIIINVHYKPYKIISYFKDRGLYFYEKELLGQENTEKELRNWLGGDYWVFNGDTLCNIEVDDLPKGYKSMQNGIYTGQKRVFEGVAEPRKTNYYWIDCGTPEGLKEARKHYK